MAEEGNNQHPQLLNAGLEASIWESVSQSHGPDACLPSPPEMLGPRGDEGCGQLGTTGAFHPCGLATLAGCSDLRTKANKKALLLESTSPPPRPGLPFRA